MPIWLPAMSDVDRLRNRLRSTSKRPNVVIIGGGISGLKTLFELKQRGINTILIEKRDELGGVWSETPHMATYYGLILNTHFSQMQLSNGVPIELEGRDYLKQSEYCGYVSRFIAENIDLEDVYLNCEVTSIHRKSASPESAALINCKAVNPTPAAPSHESFECPCVIVCHGACDTLRAPHLGEQGETFPRIVHSSQISPNDVSGKQTVLLVGFGNTAADYAVAMAEKHCKVSISTQNRTWVVPKMIAGRPIDLVVQDLQRAHGDNYGERLYSRLQHIVYCSDSDHSGSIDYRNSRIVKNDTLSALIKNQKVRITEKVREVANGRVEFIDGQSCAFDIIILCTGYQENTSLLLNVRLGRIVANLFSDDWHNVFFVGAQPLWGGTGAIIEKQVSIIADCLQDVEHHREIINFLKEIENSLNGVVSFKNGTKLYSLHEYSNLTNFHKTGGPPCFTTN